MHEKGGAILVHYEDSHVTALIDLYPELQMEVDKFNIKPKNYWNDSKNRRKFFDDYAADHKFDPLWADNWYRVRSKDIANSKASRLLTYYNGSHIRALMDVYPEVKFEKHKFDGVPESEFPMKKRRLFFDELAHDVGFDPLLPEYWYKISAEDITQRQGGSELLTYYDKSYIKALSHVYPELLLESHRFEEKKNTWNSKWIRRKFFDNFAYELGFDPLNPSEWYFISRGDVLNMKSGTSVLNYYEGSHIRALMQLYPELSLEKPKFMGCNKYVQL